MALYRCGTVGGGGEQGKTTDISFGGMMSYCNFDRAKYKTITFTRINSGSWRVGTSNNGTQITSKAIVNVTYEINAVVPLYIHCINEIGYADIKIEIEEDA